MARTAYHLMLLLVLAAGCECELLGSDEPEEPNGPVDFRNAELQKDGSICVIKTKMIEKLEKEQVKECWHQNVSSCHDTYVTEFKPSQEQLCEENFWKACKITFRENSFNYTLKTCSTPLVKVCDPPAQQGYKSAPPQPNLVCKTWYESVCNTTLPTAATGKESKPQTWCDKVPRKICAPDYCRMEPGPEKCQDKVLESTVQRPEEVCDLQPSTQCRLVTNLVPHLEAQTVCKDIPKEICHLKLDNPKMIKRPLTLKWCTRPGPQNTQAPTYLPPTVVTGDYEDNSSGYGAPPTQPYPTRSYGYSTPAPAVSTTYGAEVEEAPSPTPPPTSTYFKPVETNFRSRFGAV